jgi:hypothetical protein
MKPIAAGVGFLFTLAAHAQLLPGDVAVVAYNTDAPDDFAWVTFRDLPAGTLLKFTDSSVSNGWFRISEHLSSATPTCGPLTWSHTNDLPAGSVVRFNVFWDRGLALGAAMDLSTSGDQITIYQGVIVTNTALPYPWQGDPAAATMLHAINFANAGWDNVSGGTPSVSFVPPGLATTNGTAVHVNARDNGYYSGPTSGTLEKLRQALANPANWTTSDTPFDESPWPTNFTILPPPPEGFCIRIR